MTLASKIIFLSLWVLLGIACSSKKTTSASATPIEQQPPRTYSDDSLRGKAEIFHRFLLRGLSAEEDVALRKSCNNNPENNVFCFTVLNLDYFRAKHAKRRSGGGGGSRRGPRVYPKFHGNQVRNWQQLRFAPISRTIGSVASLTEAQLSEITQVALKEENCPNNAAVSIAAALEDKLPDRADPKQIAKLYVKGGDCLTGNSEDRKTLVTRGGLFYFYAKDYQRALETFDQAVSVDQEFISRPLFWKYQAEVRLGREDEAEETLEELIRKFPFAFHTLVAQMSNKKDPGDNVLGGSFDSPMTRSQQAPTVNLLIEQVEILHDFGLNESANLVLDWAITEADEAEPELKVYLAELKRGDRDHFSKISLLSNVLYDHPQLISRKTMELYFPKPYFPIFEKHAQGIDPYLLIAIARQESAFNPRAISGAKAQGLLQLLPKTANLLSKGSHRHLMDPEVNVRVGSQYFTSLVDKLNGQVHLALAAYNAGPNRVAVWTERYQTEDPVLFIDLIPYRETRDYVGLILRNYYWYRRINAEDEDEYPEKIIIERKATDLDSR